MTVLYADKDESNHARCARCYDLNPWGEIFRHCDESAIDPMEYLTWFLEDSKNWMVDNDGY